MHSGSDRADPDRCPHGGKARGFLENFGENLIPAVREMAQMVWHDVPSSSPAYRARHTLEILVGALLSQTQGSAKISLPLPRI